jgi:hypothetical protein
MLALLTPPAYVTSLAPSMLFSFKFSMEGEHPILDTRESIMTVARGVAQAHGYNGLSFRELARIASGLMRNGAGIFTLPAGGQTLRLTFLISLNTTSAAISPKSSCKTVGIV